MNVNREWAGALGLSTGSKRPTYGHDSSPMYSLSLLWTAGTLREAGHEVRFVDGQAEQWTAKRAVDEVTSGRYDYLIALLNLPSIYGDLELLRRIREANPGLVIVVMGAVCAVLTEEISRSGTAHFVAVREPEVTIPEILAELCEGRDAGAVPGSVCCNGSQQYEVTPGRISPSLDELPPIPHELVASEKYYRLQDRARLALTLMSKGCPFGCSYYCPYPLCFGKRVRTRSPESVSEEIEYLTRARGVEYVVFRDQNFTLHHESVRKLCDLLLSRGTGVRWICETRFNLMPDTSLLGLMRRAGCEEIHFGLESGNPEAFGTVGKPGAEFGDIDRAIKMTSKAGMQVMLHVIVGFPNDSWTTIRQTLQLVRQYDARVNVTMLLPYPGTALYEEARDAGLIRTSDWTRYSGHHTVMRTRHMSCAELEWAQLYFRWGSALGTNGVLRDTLRTVRSAAGLVRRQLSGFARTNHIEAARPEASL